MYNIHLDNPRKVEKWLSTLSEEERLVFNHGYIAALSGVVEQLRDSKIKILNKLQEIEDEDYSDSNRKVQLEARLRILDIYDDHYSKRVEHLSSRTESELLPAFD